MMRPLATNGAIDSMMVLSASYTVNDFAKAFDTVPLFVVSGASLRVILQLTASRSMWNS
jgi:hypothetical protein